MDRSISIIKKYFHRFGYRNIQYFPSRRTKFIGSELYILCSFLLKNNVSVFNSTAFYSIYTSFLKISKPRLYKLYQALFQCEQLSTDELLTVFKRGEIEIFAKEGLLLREDGKYKFNIRLVPIDKLLIASSPSRDMYSQDYVHIGYDTVTLWNFLKQEFAAKKIEKALEIGCGAGFLSLWISGFAKSVTATDISQRAIDLTCLNARINGITNIAAVKSDVYSGTPDKYDLIVSNPPFEFLPVKDKKLIHSYGGYLGMDIIAKILSGLNEHLKEHGVVYILANSYIREYGQDTLKEEIKKVLKGGCFTITMRELTYQLRPEHLSFYKKHKISHSISYLIRVRRARDFSLTTIPLQGFSQIKENLRLKALSHIGTA